MGENCDRIGLFLQFLSFWLVAPEFLGDHRINLVRKAASHVLQAFLFFPIGITLGVIGGAWVFRLLDESLHSYLRALIGAGILLAVLFSIYRAIRTDVVQRLLERLEDNHAFRTTLAWMGALLFTVGFILQFVATFLT